MKKEIFWERAEGMKVFHAFTLDSGVSLCDYWFMGGRASAEDWYEGDPKCKKCSINAEDGRKN